jgi:hypothetical protein
MMTRTDTSSPSAHRFRIDAIHSEAQGGEIYEIYGGTYAGNPWR